MNSTKSLSRLGTQILLTVALLATVATGSTTNWDPAAFAEEDVLEFFTINERGDEHWAMVWFVVIDDEVYVRLGGRAERRISENVHKPLVKIRIGDQIFDDITVTETPERNDEVADGMADKYWSALFMPLMPERYTGKLTAKPQD